MRNFNIMYASPEAIIEQTKHLFMSEDFSRAFYILRECMCPDEVTDETIFSLLKGEIGYKINGDNIDFGDEFINKEYNQEIGEILENYDFIISIGDYLFQVYESFEFDLSKIASTNSWIAELKEKEGNITSRFSFKYFDEISAMMNESGYYQFSLADHTLYQNGKFYLFKKYDTKVISEISKIYENPVEAVNKYQEKEDSYLS